MDINRILEAFIAGLMLYLLVRFVFKKFEDKVI